MREIVGIFGLVCGAVVVWTVANYGYASADDPSVKWNMAFLFAVIATGGLFGHAVSVHLWHRSRFWSVIVGLACAGALLINLSNSLGALAGKDSRSAAEAASKSSQIRDDRAELARLQKALDAIGTFTPTDETATSAAKRAADAATKSREAECAQRGNNCRAREGDERKANEDLAKATAAKASTDRANRLEAQMQPIRERLAKAGPIAATNVQGNALAKLFRLPDAEAGFMATLQQFGLAAVVEVLIVLSMISFELMAPIPARAMVIEADPVPEVPNLIVEAPRPRLVASNPESPVGSVKRILTESLETAKGAKVELAELASRYRDACKAQGKRACSLEAFTHEVATFCKAVGIKRKTEGEHLYLVDVQLVRLRGETAI